MLFSNAADKISLLNNFEPSLLHKYWPLPRHRVISFTTSILLCLCLRDSSLIRLRSLSKILVYVVRQAARFIGLSCITASSPRFVGPYCITPCYARPCCVTLRFLGPICGIPCFVCLCYNAPCFISPCRGCWPQCLEKPILTSTGKMLFFCKNAFK